MFKWFAVVLLGVQVCHAQYNDRIRSGRPGLTIGPFTTGLSVLQIQSGVNLATMTDPGQFGHTHTLRYGVLERLELGAAADLRINRVNETAGSATSLVQQWSFRVRANLLNNTGRIPSLGIQLNVALPLEEGPEGVNRLIVAVANRWNDRIGTQWNIGPSWSPQGEPGFFNIIQFAFSPRPVLRCLLEYRILATDQVFHDLHAGIALFANDDLQLDALATRRIHAEQGSWSFGLGLSWRSILKRK